MTERDVDAPSAGELLKHLVSETGALVRGEIALAHTEMTIKAKAAARASAVVVVGGAVAHAALLTLIAAAVLGLQTIMPAWMSALAMGVFLAVLGLVLVRVGLGSLRSIDTRPEQTLETLRAFSVPRQRTQEQIS